MNQSVIILISLVKLDLVRRLWVSSVVIAVMLMMLAPMGTLQGHNSILQTFIRVVNQQYLVLAEPLSVLFIVKFLVLWSKSSIVIPRIHR